MTIIERLRANLRPTGTAPIVQLHIDGYGFYDADFISKCIDDLEKMEVCAALGDGPNNLEKLAYELLLSSAYIERE
jgi:hypothetical protein